MIRKPVSKWGYVSFAAAVLVLILLLYLSLSAVRRLAEDLNRNHTTDPEQGFDAVLTYDDSLYAVVLYGQEILPGDPGHEDHLETFERSPLEKIGSRIFSAGAVYTLFVICVLTYYIYTTSNNSAVLYAKSTSFFTVIIYIVYIFFVWIFHNAMRIPFYLPSWNDLFMVITGVLPIIGGTCAAGMLLRKIRFKKTAAVIIIPVILSSFSSVSRLNSDCLRKKKSEASITSQIWTAGSLKMNTLIRHTTMTRKTFSSLTTRNIRLRCWTIRIICPELQGQELYFMNLHSHTPEAACRWWDRRPELRSRSLFTLYISSNHFAGPFYLFI